MNRVDLGGRRITNKKSAHLAEMLFEANIDECPEDELYLVPVSELEIAPCVACGACRMFAKSAGEAPDEREAKLQVPEASDAADAPGASDDGGDADGADAPAVPDFPYCPRFDDDMQDIYALLPDADELIIVSPVFFSGAPASMKAVLDRLQPHFWAGSRKAPKRPATLHVIGEGGDPHGYGPLVSEVRSALAVAGFRLERVLDWVGKIDESGEIVAEAEVVEGAEGFAPEQGDVERKVSSDGKPAQVPDRPKLNLNAGNQKSGRRQGGSDKRAGGRPNVGSRQDADKRNAADNHGHDGERQRSRNKTSHKSGKRQDRQGSSSAGRSGKGRRHG